MQRLVNPFEKAGKWYKANLHTHTTLSDGRVSPAEAVSRYRQAGYQVLALTDHERTNDLRGVSDEDIFVLNGLEFHPPLADDRPAIHLVGIGVPEGFQLADPDDAAGSIAQIRDAGGVTILAHPFWSGLEYADFGHLEGLAGVEVYNTCCDGAGRSCSENEWAYALDRGMALPALATEDTHWREADTFFESWTWLRMQSPTAANVIEALQTGSYYASCGPTIDDFRVADGKVHLRCSPAAAIYFKNGANDGCRRLAEQGSTIGSFVVELPDWPFVRAVVRDAAGRSAWTNPIFL